MHMDSDDAAADDASDDPAAMDEDDVAILGDQSGFSPMEAWVGAATLADPSFQSQLQAIDSAIISVSQQEALDARLGETDTSGSYDRAQEYPCPPPETPETPATGGLSESHQPDPDKVSRYKQLFGKVRKSSILKMPIGRHK